MKQHIALCALLLTALPFSSPSNHTLYAQDQDLPTEAQKKAIDQWAGVVRRGQTSKGMYQVAELLKEVTVKVEGNKDKAKNFIFVIALKQMYRGATLKAQGLKARNGNILKKADWTVQSSINIINGRLIM